MRRLNFASVSVYHQENMSRLVLIKAQRKTEGIDLAQAVSRSLVSLHHQQKNAPSPNTETRASAIWQMRAPSEKRKPVTRRLSWTYRIAG